MHAEILPSPPLRPYVQLIWCLELDEALDFGPTERIVADGIVELVLHYRSPMQIRRAGEEFAPQPRSSLVCQTRRFVEIRPAGPIGIVSIRFRPWGAYHFLAPPVSELADQAVAARDLWGSAVGELEERLAAAGDGRERVSLVERFLLERLACHRKRSIEGVVREIWRRKGQVRIGSLARDLGFGERRLQRLFASALGSTPKGYARVVRFLHACSQLRRGGWSSLTDVGQDCGYYDQSHFIGDFHALAGMSPGEFAAVRGVSFLELD